VGRGLGATMPATLWRFNLKSCAVFMANLYQYLGFHLFNSVT
jgi:hypothetical protein